MDEGKGSTGGQRTCPKCGRTNVSIGTQWFSYKCDDCSWQWVEPQEGKIIDEEPKIVKLAEKVLEKTGHCTAEQQSVLDAVEHFLKDITTGVIDPDQIIIISGSRSKNWSRYHAAGVTVTEALGLMRRAEWLLMENRIGR
jgi:hypothetical protein